MANGTKLVMIMCCIWDLCLAWRPGVLFGETKRTALFEKLAEDMSLQGYLLVEEIVQSEMQCIHKCINNQQCQSINYEWRPDMTQLCQLNNETRLSKPEDLVQRLGFAYYSWEDTPCVIHQPCKHGGTCLPGVNGNRVFYKCECVIGYSGDNCETYQGFHFKFSNVASKEYASIPVAKPMKAFTVSAWFAAKKVGPRNMSTLFSYANQRQPGLIVFKFDDEGNIQLVINGATRTIQYFPLTDNVWHHVSVTWEKNNGAFRVYYDGFITGSGTGHEQGLTVEGGGVLTLGQSQAAPSGEFKSGLAFLGKMSAFNMWDYILNEKSIHEFSSGVKCECSYGNIAAWTSFAEGNKYFTSSPYTMIPTDCSFIDPKSTYDVVFPRRSKTDYVIKNALPCLVKMTISFYVSYTSSGHQTFVSYATKTNTNEILVIQRNENLLLWISNTRRNHNFKVPNNSKWHNVVITWSNIDGDYVIFLNGIEKASGKLAAGKTIQGNGKMAIGNDQDSYGSGWVEADAFVGSITRLNIWSMVLSPDAAAKISTHCGKESGNAFSWKEFRQGTFNGEAKAREPSFCDIP